MHTQTAFGQFHAPLTHAISGGHIRRMVPNPCFTPRNSSHTSKVKYYRRFAMIAKASRQPTEFSKRFTRPRVTSIAPVSSIAHWLITRQILGTAGTTGSSKSARYPANRKTRLRCFPVVSRTRFTLSSLAMALAEVLYETLRYFCAV